MSLTAALAARAMRSTGHLGSSPPGGAPRWEDHEVDTGVRSPKHRPQAPLWVRRPNLFTISTPVVIGMALIAESVLLLPQDPLAAAMGVGLATAGLVTGYRLPWWGLALAAAAPLTTAVLGAEPITLWTTAVFTAFLLVLRGLHAPVTALVVGLANASAEVIAQGSLLPVSPRMLIATACGVAAVAMAAAIRGQRLYWNELEHSRREAIAGRDAAIARSIAEERVRIARDLHDLVGHEIAVVSMHLGAVEVQLPTGADKPRQHLLAARTSVQSLLAETQEILRVLHTGRDGDPAAPMADHRRIPDLVAGVRAAGTIVDIDLHQLPQALSPQVSAAAYRIVQEALTNAQRHGKGPVTIRVERDDDELIIEVSNAVDPGHPARSPGSGRGMVGMHERASAAGGQLRVDHSEDRLTVHATLPSHLEAPR